MVFPWFPRIFHGEISEIPMFGWLPTSFVPAGSAWGGVPDPKELQRPIILVHLACVDTGVIHQNMGKYREFTRKKLGKSGEIRVLMGMVSTWEFTVYLGEKNMAALTRKHDD